MVELLTSNVKVLVHISRNHFRVGVVGVRAMIIRGREIQNWAKLDYVIRARSLGRLKIDQQKKTNIS